MEVYNHSHRAAFHVSSGHSDAFDDEIVLDLNDSHCSTSKMLTFFDNFAFINTSTPNTLRTLASTNDDSGFHDSFSSDIAVSQLSNLYLNDTTSCDEEPTYNEELLPHLCLLSKFDDSDDEDTNTQCQLTSSGHLFDADAEIHNLHKNKSISNSTSQLVPLNNKLMTDRPSSSSSRRFRSPVPIVERRLRHRLSLDSYKECHSEDCILPRRRSESLSLQTLDCSFACHADSDPESSRDVECYTNCNVECMVQLTLSQLAPPCLDRLIGRKMGLDAVDIIFELKQRSMPVVVGKILILLDADDLCRMSVVSRTWLSAVSEYNSAAAVTRKQRHVNDHCDKLAIEKQNSTQDAETTERQVNMTLTRDPLVDIQPNLCTNTPSSSVSKSAKPDLAQRFWQEANKLRNDEQLMKCPHCSGPSRTDVAQERGSCTTPSCRYDFCTRCSLAFHGAQACRSIVSHSSRRSEPLIGSRRSRRNLRRL